MQTAVVTGPWQIRHHEPSEARVRLHPLDIGSEPSPSSLIVDLRPYGLNNIDPVHAPLAIVRVDGDGIEIDAMALRQDEHQVHFIRPGALGGCSAHTLGSTLHALFEKWHLRLNNFECCVFPASELSAAMHAELQAHHISPVVQGVLDAFGGPERHGFHLQSGSEVQRLHGKITVLASLEETAMIAVKSGARRKKSSFDEIAWHIERFDRAGEGWFRRKTVEPKSLDLPPFDQSPENIGALQWPEAGPWRRLCAIQENIVRIGIESARSPTLVELDIAHRICLDPSSLPESGFDLPMRSITLRPVAGRAPLTQEVALEDINALAARVAQLEEAAVGAWRQSDMPGGLSPARSKANSAEASRLA